MYATWDFLKRHRTKIGAGLAIAGTLYAAKKVVETKGVREGYFNGVQTYFDRSAVEGADEHIAEVGE